MCTEIQHINVANLKHFFDADLFTRQGREGLMMPRLRRRLARKAAMERIMVVASWLPPVIISSLAYYAIGKWLLAAIKSGLAVRILLIVAKVYAAIWGCAALILVICVVSGVALDPLNRVWRELEYRRGQKKLGRR